MSNNRTWYLWGNDLNNITAATPSKNIAWGLMRNECVEKKIQVPMFNEVHEIRALTETEVEQLKNRSNVK